MSASAVYALPDAWGSWLLAAVTEEELELEVAIKPGRGRGRDTVLALASVVVVVAASVAMEQAAAELGSRHAVPSDRSSARSSWPPSRAFPTRSPPCTWRAGDARAAVLSTSFNSNAFNVLAGLLIPTTVIGLASASIETTYLAACYAGMTVLVIVTSHVNRGLRRGAGYLIVGSYIAIAGVLVAIAY